LAADLGQPGVVIALGRELDLAAGPTPEEREA
jgi:hypothetical protein